VLWTRRFFGERFGMPLRQAYGCTEAGHVAFNRAGDPEPSWDSVGRPVGDTRVEVVPVENPFGADHGALVFHSSSLTKGYLHEPATNEMSFRNGLFLTVYIRGRSKLIVEVAGHKIDPLEVEDVLAQHPDVAEAVVVGVPSRRTGEQELKAVVVRDGDVTPEALIRFCRARLAIQKVPSIVEFIDAIPRSATGKILRGRLM
jgi:long-chain acyl-CoA synthetase